MKTMHPKTVINNQPAEDIAGQHVYIDSYKDKKSFLDFWKPFVSLTDANNANVSMFSRTELDQDEAPRNSAIIIKEQNLRANIYRIDNGIRFFGRVYRIKDPPPNLTIENTIYNGGGKPISYILKDNKKQTIFIPFSLDEVFNNYYMEKYIEGRKTILPQAMLRAYYFTRQFIPQTLKFQLRSCITRFQEKQDFPSWPLDLSFEDLKVYLLRLLLSVSKQRRLLFTWFWPDDNESCLLLTHDVETCLSGNTGIDRMISTEKKYGFRSSFNIVPFKYEIDEGVMEKIRLAGCEIGVHGYSHDARLFSSFEMFRNRVGKINEVAKKWNAKGFRSAATYRNVDWMKCLDFDYDMSFFDTDCYEPQPGGCLSFFPYFIGSTVELPMTLPQDHTIISLRKEKGIKTWQMKSSEIVNRNGMVCISFHPDPGYIGDKDNIGLYDELLGFYSGIKNIWNPLPCELAQWWRYRDSVDLKGEDKKNERQKWASAISAKWAILTNNDQVSFEAAEY